MLGIGFPDGLLVTKQKPGLRAVIQRCRWCGFGLARRFKELKAPGLRTFMKKICVSEIKPGCDALISRNLALSLTLSENFL
jgi:hypothetical protein